jgi:hypothetical protein
MDKPFEALPKSHPRPYSAKVQELVLVIFHPKDVFYAIVV